MAFLHERRALLGRGLGIGVTRFLIKELAQGFAIDTKKASAFNGSSKGHPGLENYFGIGHWQQHMRGAGFHLVWGRLENDQLLTRGIGCFRHKVAECSVRSI
jgi:hypothetical protein